MADATFEVIYKREDVSRIPDILREGVALLLLLWRGGLGTSVAGRVRIRRQGGYSGLDVWLYLWLFYASGAARSVKKFWVEVLQPHKRKVAALAGRSSLMSPSSLSRALGSVETDLLRPQATWLLAGASGVDEVLRHPMVKTYDTTGRGWHVFDYDPTVTTLRNRALPRGEDLPEPRRRSEDTAAPGYSGRKRGEVQCRRCTVQHSGSSAWVHAHLNQGNGEGIADLERALDSIVETCERLGHPLTATLVRIDGEHGNVPGYTVCRERGLPFITRLTRPKLFEDPEVLARLRAATWHRVADSRSGPRRAAADLGVMTVAPGERTRRLDGTPYEPVTLRVVASIFPNDGEAGRGTVLDGWQVELFAADVPADAWPAPEVVTAYFGRIAEENRFAQEDRELGLDRLVSYHLPGQELATLVGLSVWNTRIVLGLGLEPPPAERCVEQLRQAEVDDRVPAHWPRDPVLIEQLAELDWASMLVRRPGWVWNAPTGELVCPDGRALTLTTVRPAPHAPGRTRIIFLRPAGGCEDCEPRDDCFRSSRDHAVKHAEFSVPSNIADNLRARLALVRGQARGTSPRIEPITVTPGPLAVADPLFLPARARSDFRACFLGATLRIRVDLPQPEPTRPRLVAEDIGDRQRRRKTWQQNLDRYALPEGAKVFVEVAGRNALRQMLGDPTRQRVAVGG